MKSYLFSLRISPLVGLLMLATSARAESTPEPSASASVQAIVGDIIAKNPELAFSATKER